MEKITFLESPRFEERVQTDKMVETPFTKEVRICMAKGNTMKEHTAPGAITIMVLKGLVAVASGSETVDLGDGEMVCFDANIPHSLKAKKQSIIRLSLSKNDSVSRVFSLV